MEIQISSRKSLLLTNVCLIKKRKNYMINMEKRPLNKVDLKEEIFSHKCSEAEVEDHKVLRKENQSNTPLKSLLKKFIKVKQLK